EVIKIPEPIIEPITIIVASIGPSARTRLVWTFVGEAVGFPRTTSSSPTLAVLSILSLIVELETARPRAEEIPLGARARQLHCRIKTSDHLLFRDMAPPRGSHRAPPARHLVQRNAIFPSSFHWIEDSDRSNPP